MIPQNCDASESHVFESLNEALKQKRRFLPDSLLRWTIRIH
jgi:hypothetical protein